MTTMDDSLQARISAHCPDPIRHVLLMAWSRDQDGIRAVMRQEPALANAVDPTTFETPLHAAVRGCGAAQLPYVNATAAAVAEGIDEDADPDDALRVSEARYVITELFLAGAIWNDLDGQNETPACVAWRLGRVDLYDLFVIAGMRAELLFGLMGGYEQLSSNPTDAEPELMPKPGNGNASDQTALDFNQESAEITIEAYETTVSVPVAVDLHTPHERPATPHLSGFKSTADTTSGPLVSSGRYLRSRLTFLDRTLLDADGNGVMMAWETDIMRHTVDALLATSHPPAPSSEVPPPLSLPANAAGRRILNIGFGMGIIDSLFQATHPARHHIIEAHPAVLARLASPESAFGPAWQASQDTGVYAVHAGRWQDVIPDLLSRGEMYDIIYFDTFAEDYAQLKYFFTEHLVGLLDPDGGRFSFFNGLGADRRVCYDVYKLVVEVDLADAGFNVDWTNVDVDMCRLAESGRGDWNGVRRRYWTLDNFLYAPFWSEDVKVNSFR